MKIEVLSEPRMPPDRARVPDAVEPCTAPDDAHGATAGVPRRFDDHLRAAARGAHAHPAARPADPDRQRAPREDAAPADGATGDDDPPAPTPAPVIAAALALVQAVTAPTVTAPSTKVASAPEPAVAVEATPNLPELGVQAGEPQAPDAPMTPLEEAVHALIEQLRKHDEPDQASAGEPPPALVAPVAVAAPPPERSAPGHDQVAAPAGAPRAEAPAPPPAPTSHVHLVLDDGPDRVVVTVAVRGSDVHVALRASDDLVSANLARNAAVLDHAMRARGLVLAELASDPQPERGHRDREPPRRHHPPTAEPFELEETA